MHLHIQIYVLFIRLPLLLWTCSAWRQMAVAMLLRRRLWLRRIHVCNLGPQEESFMFGCIVWLFRSWHTHTQADTHTHTHWKSHKGQRKHQWGQYPIRWYDIGEVNKVMDPRATTLVTCHCRFCRWPSTADKRDGLCIPLLLFKLCIWEFIGVILMHSDHPTVTNELGGN